ncbi:hypothetical protein OQA88_581 [Cercophora sp. LCS_1]
MRAEHPSTLLSDDDRLAAPSNSDLSSDPKATDPPLLERNSQIKSYATSKAKYEGLRVFYRRHPQADKLPRDPAPIPLLVFIHGLGGSVAQFNSLLTSLTPIASCLAVDLPGCGRSDYVNRSWDAYTTDALTELLETVIEDHREKEDEQSVVLIGHSMGASLCALLAHPRAATTQLSRHVTGLVAICPPAGPWPEDRTKMARWVFWVPEFLFDLWRAWDRRGGAESRSVRRFVGQDADPESKRLQNLYNSQSRTPVFRRMASGCLADWHNGVARGGLPGPETWSQLNIPVFVVAGELDNVCSPAEAAKVVGYITGTKQDDKSDTDEALPDSAAPVDTSVLSTQPSTPLRAKSSRTVSDLDDADFVKVKNPPSDDSQPEDPTTPNDRGAPAIPPLPLHPPKIVRSAVLKKPATHALLYTPTTAPILAGLISDFLNQHVTGRLDLGWQLQHLCRDGKWDVKNLEKWRSVAPVSEPIGGVFRAIKTLREVDEEHTPRKFVKNWGSIIKDVVDISHDNPVYDPKGLIAGGIKYHKFPTVSKVPPADAEVKGFIDLVDKIRADQKARHRDCVAVGVHCHYGFNRTGFLIVCYLVERCGYTAKDAIEHFARSRPHGIKHAHFKDRLYVRYSGLEG